MNGAHVFLDRSAQASPDFPAIVHGENVMSYRTLQRASCALANALIATGLAAGARIGTYMSNHPASFVCQFGINRTSYVWLPVNPKAAVPEAIGILAGFGAEWLFVDRQIAEQADAIRGAVPTLKGLVCIDARVPGLIFLDDWLAEFPDSDPSIPVGPLDTAVLRTTSGSTGEPKGVKRTNLCQVLQVMDYLTALPFDAPPISLVLTPLSHAAGSIALPVFEARGTHHILNSTAPDTVLRYIETHRISSVFMPPTLIYSLLAHPSVRTFDYSSLRYIIYGTAPMSRHRLAEAWDVFGPVFAQVYGMTEASSTISIFTPAQHAEAMAHHPGRLASCGRGSPNYRIKVIDSDGRDAPAGTSGEIVCASYEIMSGYFENESATRDTVRNGWLHTGDVGYIDRHGYLYIVDRIKDVIISGGFNVYPAEVENVIRLHSAIHDCAVVGSPDEKWGESVTAVVELKPGCALTVAELIEHCKTHLGSVKAPKRVTIVDALPRNLAGKTDKKAIRKTFWREADRAI